MNYHTKCQLIANELGMKKFSKYYCRMMKKYAPCIFTRDLFEDFMTKIKFDVLYDEIVDGNGKDFSSSTKNYKTINRKLYKFVKEHLTQTSLFTLRDRLILSKQVYDKKMMKYIDIIIYFYVDKV